MRAHPIDATEVVARVRADGRAARAEAWLRAAGERTLETQIEISEIPSPPFGEETRGRRVAEMLETAGLGTPHVDTVGNVVASRNGHRARGSARAAASSPGAPGAPPAESAPFVVSAHLDTVFPIGTDVRVHRRGDLLRGPGVSDDARGLAALVTLAEAIVSCGLDPPGPLLFVATVGEEGEGDLRGVRHLFSEEGAAYAASGFVSLDGAGLGRLVTRGLGARRFRVTARGPGGHSWIDWGKANPIHELAPLAARIAGTPLPRNPATTLTLARWSGGTSINAIPAEAWFEIDTRSEDPDALAQVEREIRRLVADAASSAARDLGIELASIGDRPAGATDERTLLVRSAVAATRTLGVEPETVASSTDANIAMARGIPAITMGCGGTAGKAHTTREWYRDDRGADGLVRALLTVLAASGYAREPSTIE